MALNVTLAIVSYARLLRSKFVLSLKVIVDFDLPILSWCSALTVKACSGEVALLFLDQI